MNLPDQGADVVRALDTYAALHSLTHSLGCARYQQDNDREDLHWTEVFCKPRKTRVVSLPPAAAAILREHGFDSPVKNNPPPKRKRPLLGREQQAQVGAQTQAIEAQQRRQAAGRRQ